MRRWELPRRTFLRGLGATMALPLLEQMMPGVARAQALGKPPARRLVVLYVPCGIHMEAWTPAKEGSGYALTPILQPLAPMREHVLVVTGLANAPAYPDGGAPHEGGTGSFLTARKILPGGRIGNGVSMDQVAAKQLGQDTPYPSLELGLDGSASGVCEGGYSCAYLNNIAWASETLQLSKEVNPQALFARLFGASGQSGDGLARRRRRHQSVLDTVREDAQRLNARLGLNDRRRMEEYLTGVRELERRMTQLDAAPACTPGAPPSPVVDIRDHTRAMLELMVLALKCDMTRVITFMMGNGASSRRFPFLGYSGQHHALSHHQNDPEKIAAIVDINTWEVSQLASFLQRMSTSTEPDGSTLLESSVVLFASEMGDGNTHDRRNIPVLLAGRAGGQLHPGRHLRVPSGQPLASLYLSLLGMLGVHVGSFGEDGTAPLQGL
ncbi:MAG: DUF1552 domain-containing protein [Myxococcaceae bacterium]|nr:DUF1552 domain-containing protein [Myxococcaceae bacterium]MCI0670212.1 DUF1552 domain-containing protein [Myxococcaceae bacterium]